MSHTSYTCPRCEKTSFPGFVLNNAGKLRVECTNPECLFIDQTLGPEDFSKGIAVVDAGASSPGWAGKKTAEVSVSERAPAGQMRPFGAAPMQPAPQVAAPPPVATAPQAVSLLQAAQPFDMPAFAAQRLAQIDAYLAPVEALKLERRMWMRVLGKKTRRRAKRAPVLTLRKAEAS